LEEYSNYQNVYHITSQKNAKLISKNGLQAQENIDGRYGSFVFKNKEDAELFNSNYYDGKGSLIEIPTTKSEYEGLIKDKSGDMPESSFYYPGDLSYNKNI
jgi:hypothetical protein